MHIARDIAQHHEPHPYERGDPRGQPVEPIRQIDPIRHRRHDEDSDRNVHERSQVGAPKQVTEDVIVDHLVFQKGNVRERAIGLERGMKTKRRPNQQSDGNLPRQFDFRRKAPLVLPERLDIVVHESEHPHPGHRQHGKPDIRLGDRTPQEGRYENRQDDDDPPHGGRTGLVRMTDHAGSRAFPNGFAQLLRAQHIDDAAPYEQRDE